MSSVYIEQFSVMLVKFTVYASSNGAWKVVGDIWVSYTLWVVYKKHSRTSMWRTKFCAYWIKPYCPCNDMEKLCTHTQCFRLSRFLKHIYAHWSYHATWSSQIASLKVGGFDHQWVSPNKQHTASFMFCHGTQSMHIAFATGFISPSGVARTPSMPGHSVSTPRLWALKSKT